MPRRAIVYSNEWLDALPFQKVLIFERTEPLVGAWSYLGVKILRKKNSIIPAVSFEKVNQDIDGYVVDWSLEALEVLSKLASQSDWKGIF